MSSDDVEPALVVHMTRDSTGFVTSVDDSIVQVLGWRPDQLIGSASTVFVHPEDQASAIAAWIAMINSPGTSHGWKGRYRHADGRWSWVETLNSVDRSTPPSVSSSLWLMPPEQLSSEEDRRAREQVLSRLADALPLGVFQIDVTGHISFSNERLELIMGRAAATVRDQMSRVVDEDQHLVVDALTAVMADQTVDDVEVRVALDEGPQDTPTPRVCSLSLRPLTDSTGVVTGAVGCVSDVTDRAQLRRELEIKASVDALTSCLNRAATLELLRLTVAAAAESAEGIALLFVDLDDFKIVNDSYGHSAGDLVLVSAAERLRRTVRDCDHIGRMGGDEFLVICPGVKSSEVAMHMARRIGAEVAGPVGVGLAVVELRASIGVVWTERPVDVEGLVAQADKAMYESKRSGTAGVSLFEADGSTVVTT